MLSLSDPGAEVLDQTGSSALTDFEGVGSQGLSVNEPDSAKVWPWGRKALLALFVTSAFASLTAL